MAVGDRFKDLAAAAMIGADRAGGDGGPGAILTRAAVLGARGRAGWIPRSEPAELATCPADAKPVANARAMAILDRLLADPDAGLLEEWAHLAKARGVRAAERSVPAILDWWSRQPKRSEAVFDITGAHGRWLASLNPAWDKPVALDDIPADVDERWQTAKAAERAMLLMTVRRRDPARGLAMIASTWASDGAEERRRFLEVVAEAPTMDDEPFLDAALDDRAKTVRKQAASTLAMIPGSRLRARMVERARAFVKVETKKRLLRAATTEVSLEPPKEFAAEWERDGVDEAAPGSRGQRAWWMRQIFAAAGPEFWARATGLEPAAILEALANDDHLADAVDAIAEAAATARDAAWLRVIALRRVEQPKSGWESIAPLWSGLSATEREPLALEVASATRFAPVERWLTLASCDHAWSPAFSVAVAKLLIAHAPSKATESWQLWSAAEAISRAIHPSASASFEAAIMAFQDNDPTESFRKSIDRVRLRADLHKEFA